MSASAPLRRLSALAAALCLAAAALAILAGPAAAAESPWWGLTSQARPTYLKPARAEVQEISGTPSPATGELLFELYVRGQKVGQFWNEPSGLFQEASAANIQAALEATYGAGDVDVTGGPVGTEAVTVTTAERLGAAQELEVKIFLGNTASYGTAQAEILTEGRVSTVVVTATNLGDAQLSGAQDPVTIRDELPAGMTALGAEAFDRSFLAKSPSLSCHIEEPAPGRSEVVCTYGGALQPYELIEMFIPVGLRPGAEGGRNEVRVSGGQSGRCEAVPVDTGKYLDRGCQDLRLEEEVFEPANYELTPVPDTGVPAGSLSAPLTVAEGPTPFGTQQFTMSAEEEGGAPASRAAAHPFQFTTTLVLNQGAETVIGDRAHKGLEVAQRGMPHDLHFELPPGLIGNASRIPQCTMKEFVTTETYNNFSEAFNATLCPSDTAIGVALVQDVVLGYNSFAVPIFNLVPGPGEPARFGFNASNIPVTFDTSVRSGSDYGVDVDVHSIAQLGRFFASQVTLWGNPGSAAHHLSRGSECIFPHATLFRNVCIGNAEGQQPKALPFLRMPTACAANPAAQPLLSTVEGDSWPAFEVPLQRFGPVSYTFPNEAGEPLGLTECQSEPFEPSLELAPESRQAATPTGLNATVHIPQEAAEAPEGTAPSDLKDTTVVLPKGISVDPSSANGLGACTEAQIGYKAGTSEPAEFTPGPAECPDASKIGTVEIRTPLLDHPIGSPGGPAGNVGAVYVAEPHENPFGSLLAIYIAVDDPISGTVVKLPGKVTPDPVTGQLTTTFADTPQLPFEDFKLSFFGGPRAALKTPDVCGTYTSNASFVPWSGTAAVASDPSFRISEGPGGGACPAGEAGEPNSPAFSAGTLSPLAGRFSPFVLHLGRADGSQQFSRIDTTLPEGLVGSLAGIPYCPDSALAAAAAKSGRAEQAAPSCPAASQVGTVTVGAGAGPRPYYTRGTVYLAGPYKGAPLSLAIITPAVAGPYDLGTVVVRVALDVDPETARITAMSDPIPSILQGIPLDVRSIAMRMDRPDFTLNPTSCEEMAIGGTETSTLGQAAPLADRFQAAECAALPFKPSLKIRLKGATGRIGHPALRAVVTARPGEANIARAQVNLPHGEFLDQSNLNKTCTKPVLLAGDCPASSVYGRARAWTPLLEKPLEGNVYLVGGYGYKLPALVAELNGQIKVLLVGKVDSGKNEGIRSTFEVVPDAPVSRFELAMKGGKKYGLLENSENLCKASKQARQAIARFTGQNGKVDAFKPVVANQCGKRKGHARRKGHTAGKHHRHGGKKGAGKGSGGR